MTISVRDATSGKLKDILLEKRLTRAGSKSSLLLEVREKNTLGFQCIYPVNALMDTTSYHVSMKNVNLMNGDYSK